MPTPPPVPVAVRRCGTEGVGQRRLVSERTPMSFNPNTWAKNAKSSHVLWVVGALYVIYYWDLIVLVALICGTLWLIGKMTDTRNG